MFHIRRPPPQSPSHPPHTRRHRFTILSISSLLTLTLLALCLIPLASPQLANASTPPPLPTPPPPPSQPTESFTEHLLLRPLPDGRLHTSFDFTLTSSSDSHHHFQLLPRALLQAVQAYDVQEVHLSLNTGRWHYAKWRSPQHPIRSQGQHSITAGDQDVAPGAQLWARLRHPRDPTASKAASDEATPQPPFAPPQHVARNWADLTSSLAGLFCTSLNALDSRSTVLPNLAFQPTSPDTTTTTVTTLHAFLPSESICTENLTPLLKLLPCKGHAGLASLLNPLSLLAADFQGMAVHVVRRPPPHTGWEVKLSVQAVFSPAVTRDVSSRDWSFRSIFDRKLEKSCPLAAESIVRVTTPDDQGFVSQFVLEPLPARLVGPAHWSTSGQRDGDEVEEDDLRGDEGGGVVGKRPSSWLSYFQEESDDDDDEEAESSSSSSAAWLQHWLSLGSFTYDVLELTQYNSSLDLSMTWPTEERYRYPTSIAPPRLAVTRMLSGSGQQRSRLVTTLRNNDASGSQTVVYFETLPWFVTPLLHTLRCKVEADAYDESSDAYVRFLDEVMDDPIVWLDYQPSVARLRPFVVEMRIKVPARTTVRLEMEVRKEFLRYGEHPPDAHRGFDMPPAVVLVERADEGQRDGRARVYTTSNLVELATPDFSFVYTNIIFTSTVVALFFGSTLNGFVRRFRDVVV